MFSKIVKFINFLEYEQKNWTQKLPLLELG